MPCSGCFPTNGVQNPPTKKSQRVDFNVGGTRFSTVRSTIEKFPKCTLAELIQEAPGEDGAYFLDRTGEVFIEILTFMRDGVDSYEAPTEHETIKRVKKEAQQLNLPELESLISAALANQTKKQASKAFSNPRMFCDNVTGCSLRDWAPRKAQGPDEEASPGSTSIGSHSSVAPTSSTADTQDFSTVQTMTTADLELKNGGIEEALEAQEEEYVGAPIPDNEAERLSILENLNVMYTEREHQHDCISTFLAAALEVPIVLLSLVHKDEQWFKTKHGLDATATPRNTSFCALMLRPHQPKAAWILQVEDATKDPRLCNNPLVRHEPYIRFYCGCPLITSSGHRVGALCCIDREPRSFSATQIQLLANFGHLAVRALMADKLRAEAKAEAKLGESKAEEDDPPFDKDAFAGGVYRHRRIRDSLDEMVCLVWVRPDSKQWPMLYGSKEFTDTTGLKISPPPSFPGWPEVEQEDDACDPGLKSIFLWHHMVVADCDAAKLTGVCQAVNTSLDKKDLNVPMFSLTASMVSGLRCKAGLKVLCRFSPASQPLDVAADVAEHPSQLKAAAKQISLKGFPKGLLYFVTIRVFEHGSTAEPLPEERIKTRPPVPVHTRGGLSVGTPTPPKAEDVSKREEAREGELKEGASESVAVREAGGKQEAEALDDSLRDKVEEVYSQYSGRRMDLTQLQGERVKRSPHVNTRPNQNVRILKLAGVGSFGKVYFGLWSGSPVAVKVICNASWGLEKLSLSPDVEAELSALVSHRNLVQTYQYYTKDVQQVEGDSSNDKIAPTDPALQRHEMWIIQEWCDMGTLRENCLAPRTTDLELRGAALIFLDIAWAIEYLHSKHIIHGDLTPNNVLLKKSANTNGFICKVCDFGHARVCQVGSEEIMTRTLGTVTHMPPELFRANLEHCVLTPKADIYAMGMILHEVLEGARPFAGLSMPQVVLRVATGMAVTLSPVYRGQLNEVFESCVNRMPSSRPSANDLAETLNDHIVETWGAGSLT